MTRKCNIFEHGLAKLLSVSSPPICHHGARLLPATISNMAGPLGEELQKALWRNPLVKFSSTCGTINSAAGL